MGTAAGGSCGHSVADRRVLHPIHGGAVLHAYACICVDGWARQLCCKGFALGTRPASVACVLLPLNGLGRSCRLGQDQHGSSTVGPAASPVRWCAVHYWHGPVVFQCAGIPQCVVACLRPCGKRDLLPSHLVRDSGAICRRLVYGLQSGQRVNVQQQLETMNARSEAFISPTTHSGGRFKLLRCSVWFVSAHGPLLTSASSASPPKHTRARARARTFFHSMQRSKKCVQ
mmetsp:Transcript_7217/g.12184  ORF Transcript_7217/g.12184 Transcript_7217/m.12184 type:complete len:229 (-) Transcript_7217:97-783(-)